MMAWVAFEPMLLGSLTLGSSAAPFDLLHDAMRALLGLQREIQRSLASEFRAARESSSARSSLVLMGMAFAFGAVHAVTPGHGKAISLWHPVSIESTPIPSQTSVRRAPLGAKGAEKLEVSPGASSTFSGASWQPKSRRR
jgi:hypothetical protein